MKIFDMWMEKGNLKVLSSREKCTVVHKEAFIQKNTNS